MCFILIFVFLYFCICAFCVCVCVCVLGFVDLRACLGFLFRQNQAIKFMGEIGEQAQQEKQFFQCVWHCFLPNGNFLCVDKVCETKQKQKDASYSLASHQRRHEQRKEV